MSDLWLCPGCNRWQPIENADCPTCGPRSQWTVAALDPTADRRGVTPAEVNVTPCTSDATDTGFPITTYPPENPQAFIETNGDIWVCGEGCRARNSYRRLTCVLCERPRPPLDAPGPISARMTLTAEQARRLALDILHRAEARRAETREREARRPTIGDADEMIAELRAAGLDAWDRVEDPEKFLRELRGYTSYCPVCGQACPTCDEAARREKAAAAIASGSPDAPPQFKDHAVDITGGVESAEYVRGLRDEDTFDPTARPVEEVVAEIFEDVTKEEWDRLDAANRVCKTCGARCLHCNPPTTPDEFFKALTAKTPEPTESAGEVLEEFSRNLHVPQDGTSGMAAIMGKWPGGETDEEIDEALKKLS